MKLRLSVILATLLCAGSVLPVTAQADDNRPHPLSHLAWVHRHFIWHNGHRVFWVPGHPAIR